MLAGGAAVVALAVLLVAKAAGDQVFPDLKIAPDKQANMDAVEETRRVALLTPRGAYEGYCPPPTPVFTPTHVPEMLLQDVRSRPHGLYYARSWWHGDVDGVETEVITGASNLDRQTGAILIYRYPHGVAAGHPEYGALSVEGGTGALRIEGESDSTFQLSSEGNQTFVFDVRTLSLTRSDSTPAIATVYPLVTIQPKATLALPERPCRQTITAVPNDGTPVPGDGTPIPPRAGTVTFLLDADVASQGVQPNRSIAVGASTNVRIEVDASVSWQGYQVRLNYDDVVLDGTVPSPDELWTAGPVEGVHGGNVFSFTTEPFCTPSYEELAHVGEDDAAGASWMMSCTESATGTSHSGSGPLVEFTFTCEKPGVATLTLSAIDETFLLISDFTKHNDSQQSATITCQ